MKRFQYLILLSISIISFQILSAQPADPNKELIREMNDKDYHSNVVVLYDSTDVDVMETGLSYVTKHRLIKIMNENGAKAYRQVNINYDPLSAFIEIRFARIYRKNGTIEIIDSSRFYDHPAPARMIYWGGRNKTIEFGRLEPGDAIETIVFRKGFTYALLTDDDDKFIPPMRGHYYDIVNFWSGTPTLEKVYRIALPEGKPLQYEVYNGEVSSYIHFPKKNEKDIIVEVNPKELSDKSSYAEVAEGFYQRDDKIVYCWYKKNLKPFKREPNMVSASNVAPKLLLSTSQDWYAKAVWFNKVNEDYGSFEVTPEVQKMTDEIIKGAKDELDKISKLTHWAAEEIRYSGISMGEGEGYTLHKGEMTFADRCGVCKDKAGMLVTMLRAAGFESYPAMTMAGSRIDKIPSDQFNHSVTLAKLSNGHWILLDPTWVPGVRELWSSAEQQQQFLMGIPGGADLMTTPLSNPENQYLKMTGKSTLMSDGTLEGSFTLTAEGQTDATIRRKFNRSYQSTWKEIIPSYLANISPDVKIIEQKYSDPYDISEPFKIEVKYIIPDYALITDDKIIFIPLLAKNPMNDNSTAGELRTDTSLTERKFGFSQRCSKLVQIEETIKLPKFKSKKVIPAFITISGKYAGFNAKYVLDGNKLILKAEHSMGKRLYEPNDWTDFRTALVERLKLMDSEIILQK
ncbi:DUF3857 domain-containing transglutaminase family protein [Bacteroidota bacterium]